MRKNLKSPFMQEGIITVCCLLVKWFSGSKFKLPKMSKDFLNDGWKDDRHNMVNRAHFSIQLRGVQK